VTLRLRLLEAGEIAELTPKIEQEYAADVEQHGGLDRDAARAKAAREIPQVLADPVNQLFALEQEGSRVGHLWVGERELHGRRVLWIWDVFVEDRYRRRGYGRAAMQLAEGEARRRGLPCIRLNVFGGNEGARGLYRSLDYQEIAVVMGKDVP
jgi:ribosomal protein S18 acetylase RimI-like enzyme